MERLVALVVLAAAARARVVHRSVAHLERDFALCVGEISVKDEYRTVRFAPEESGPAAAGRLMRAAGVTEGAAFDASVRNIGAFLEHRASLALMERSEFRHALRETQRVGAPALFLTSQACAEGAAPLVNAILDRHAPWAMLDLNHFNADRGSDWRFYFGDRPVAAVAIGCQATRPLDDAALRRVVDHAAKHLLPGAVLQLVVDEARYDAVAALIEAAGFSDVGGVDAAIHGPTPRSLFDIGPGFRADEMRNEAACADGAPGLLVEAFAPAAAGVPAGPLAGVASVQVLNLARRRDRWEAVVAKCAAAGFAAPPTRVDAVDGAALDVADAAVAEIFNLTNWRYGGAKNAHQDHGYRPRVIGCALSHLAAWRAIAGDGNDHAIHLVLEDDVVFESDFARGWAALAADLVGDYTWDLVQLGVLDDRDLYGDTPLAEYAGVARFSGRQRSYGAGAFAYALRPRTARWLLAQAAAAGIQQAVDWWLVERYDVLVAYKALPPLAASPAGEGRDSDNDEFYDQDRLLLEGGGAPPPLEGTAFRLSAPVPGAAVDVGESLDVRAEMTVGGDAKTFILERALMRICYDVRVLAHGKAPASVNEKPLCVGLARANQFQIPGALLEKAAWYTLDAKLLDGDEAVAATSVIFEARDGAADDNLALPPPLGAVLPATVAPIAVAVDGAALTVDCAGRDLFECVRDFCEGNRIQPTVQCMASLAASFQATVLDGGGSRGEL